MEFKRFEALLEMFPKVQIFSAEGDDLDRVISHYLNQQKNVATMSEAIQRKIQRALAPFWQQRFISMHDSDAPLVKNLLLDKKFMLQSEHYIDDVPFPETDSTKLKYALEVADLSEQILNRKLLSLSNGELRRVLLARLLMENPKIIYFNDLFGGLDPEFREHLSKNVVSLTKNSDMKIVLRLAREDELLPEIPAFIYAQKIFTQYENVPSEFQKPKFTKAELQDYQIIQLNKNAENSVQPKETETLFALKNVNVKFGEIFVLKNLNWTVNKGEHWVVMGENGAGKSTLLGLLTADHPQIYSNDITLLGMRPGHGLNIWEHKAKLGFFSPELALQYREDLDILDVLCTGFTPALCKATNITWEERKRAKNWLNYLGFSDVSVHFKNLSDIDKRVVLMARASIRPPKILLLDEPTQGLVGDYRSKIFNLLQLLSKETTIILVSHYEEEWPPCMTHLLRMPKFSLNENVKCN